MAPYKFLRPSEDASCFHVDNPQGLDVRLFANHDVPFEQDAFEQLFEFLDVERAAREIREQERRGAKPFFGDAEAGIDRVVLTPDFHKGSLVPVGTVARAQHMCIPQAIGNDICCGMRLLVTDLPAEALTPHWPAIQKRLRAIFFAGERDIPMSPSQREAVLRDGLPGLVETAADNRGRGIWSRFDGSAARDDLQKAHANGSFATRRLFGFEKFIQSSGEVDSRDPQIGCVGGGNHFVELQRVDALYEGHAARDWGLSKGALAIMIHSGSVGLGHAVGGHFMDRAREIFPKNIRAPKGGFYPLPTAGPLGEEGLFYLDGMGNAANFAFANRMFLGLMALRAIEEATGRNVASKLVYDAPHNLVFQDGESFLHRKGATPAHGPTATDWLGKPVIIPGSMGAASYLLAGEGNAAALDSACHGAGRSLSRGRAAHADPLVFERALEGLRIVGPIDPRHPSISRRRDILVKYQKRMMEEAPYAYKAVEPVVESVQSAGIAHKVAKLFPLCTVKG
jgi:tRNA-splicing ligase RtcB (3'-phosphate/5'-hydroxy nucleic acid ligase)